MNGMKWWSVLLSFFSDINLVFLFENGSWEMFFWFFATLSEGLKVLDARETKKWVLVFEQFLGIDTKSALWHKLYE